MSNSFSNSVCTTSSKCKCIANCTLFWSKKISELFRIVKRCTKMGRMNTHSSLELDAAYDTMMSIKHVTWESDAAQNMLTQHDTLKCSSIRCNKDVVSFISDSGFLPFWFLFLSMALGIENVDVTRRVSSVFTQSEISQRWLVEDLAVFDFQPISKLIFKNLIFKN